MPDRPPFELEVTEQRAMVRLRVRPNAADRTCALLGLPKKPLTWQGDEIKTCWLGPEQWLLISDHQPAEAILTWVETGLQDQLHAATDLSSGLACFSLGGPAASAMLSMGSGVDFHPAAFRMGQCVRTRFAQIPVFIVAIDENRFDLYADRSLSNYLNNWLLAAGEDPLLRSRSESNDG